MQKCISFLEVFKVSIQASAILGLQQEEEEDHQPSTAGPVIDEGDDGVETIIIYNLEEMTGDQFKKAIITIASKLTDDDALKLGKALGIPEAELNAHMGTARATGFDIQYIILHSWFNGLREEDRESAGSTITNAMLRIGQDQQLESFGFREEVAEEQKMVKESEEEKNQSDKDLQDPRPNERKKRKKGKGNLHFVRYKKQNSDMSSNSSVSEEEDEGSRLSDASEDTPRETTTTLKGVSEEEDEGSSLSYDASEDLFIPREKTKTLTG